MVPSDIHIPCGLRKFGPNMSAYLVQNTLQYNLHNIPVKHHDIRTSAYFSYSFMFIPCLNGLLMDFLANVYPNYWIIGFLLTGRRHSWAVADRDLLPAVFWIWARHGRPAEVSEAPGVFPVKEKNEVKSHLKVSKPDFSVVFLLLNCCMFWKSRQILSE